MSKIYLNKWIWEYILGREENSVKAREQVQIGRFGFVIITYGRNKFIILFTYFRYRA